MTRERLAELCLILGAVVTWGGIALFTAEVHHAGNRDGLASWLPVDLLYGPGPAVVGGLAWVGLVAIAARQRSNVWAPLVAFLLVGAFATAQNAAWPDGEVVQHGKLLPATVLLLMAAARWRFRGDEARATETWVDLAAGAAGALYFWSAVSKLWASGIWWAWNSNLPLLVLERSYGMYGGGLLQPLRAVAASHTALAVTALVVLIWEAAGALLVFPALRMRLAAGFTVMHLCIGVLMGYWYVEWWLNLWAIALLTPPPRGATASAAG